MDQQIEVFEDIRNMKYSMQALAGYMQNDFKAMLDDGTTTKEGIQQAIKDMDVDFDKAINELNQLREKARDVMQHYSK